MSHLGSRWVFYARIGLQFILVARTVNLTYMYMPSLGRTAVSGWVTYEYGFCALV